MTVHYMSCRYVCSTEACHRLFGFNVSNQVPAVTRLAVHEEGQQAVFFKATDDATAVVNRRNTSSLLEWFEMNKTDPAARQYTYLEFPRHYVWSKNKKAWSERKQQTAVGRMYSTMPGKSCARL